jgi:hypothetical protein
VAERPSGAAPLAASHDLRGPKRRLDVRHIEVLGAGTLRPMDETHIGRTMEERAVEGHVLKDNGSRYALKTEVGRRTSP